jgi:hypothetical protein
MEPRHPGRGNDNELGLGRTQLLDEGFGAVRKIALQVLNERLLSGVNDLFADGVQRPGRN